MAENSPGGCSTVYGGASGSVIRRSQNRSASSPVQLYHRHVPPTTRSAVGVRGGDAGPVGEGRRQPHVVAVEEGDVPAACDGDPEVPRRAHAAVLVAVMLDVADPRRIARRPRLGDRRAGVGGSVVDEDQLPVVEARLVHDTRDGLVDERRAVEEDQDARDVRDPCAARVTSGRAGAAAPLSANAPLRAHVVERTSRRAPNLRPRRRRPAALVPRSTETRRRPRRRRNPRGERAHADLGRGSGS